MHGRFASESTFSLTEAIGLILIGRSEDTMKAIFADMPEILGSLPQIIATAEKEIAEQTPTIVRRSVLAHWSILEAGIRDLMVGWLTHHPPARANNTVRGIRVSIADYEAMSVEDRMRFLVDEIEHTTHASLKKGVGRFEEPLAAIGLGGGVPKDLRRRMMFFAEVRNLLLHRAGVVDKKFQESCPWTDTAFGEPLKPEVIQAQNCEGSAHDYVTTVMNRMMALDSGSYETVIKEMTDDEWSAMQARLIRLRAGSFSEKASEHAREANGA